MHFDIEIHAREILTLRARLNEIFVKHTGQDVSAIEEAIRIRTEERGEHAV